MTQLTDEQRRRFAEDGFLVLDRFVEPEQVARVVARFEPLFRGQFETGLYPDEWSLHQARTKAADQRNPIVQRVKDQYAAARRMVNGGFQEIR